MTNRKQCPFPVRSFDLDRQVAPHRHKESAPSPHGPASQRFHIGCRCRGDLMTSDNFFDYYLGKIYFLIYKREKKKKKQKQFFFFFQFLLTSCCCCCCCCWWCSDVSGATVAASQLLCADGRHLAVAGCNRWPRWEGWERRHHHHHSGGTSFFPLSSCCDHPSLPEAAQSQI